MSSGNAFARGSTSINGMEKDDDTPRQPKRVRLAEAEDVYEALERRTANVDSSLEVDHMILDYLAFNTIKACLANRDPNQRSASSTSLSSNLSMSDTFLSVFKARHPRYKEDSELRFRLKLLKLVSQFTQRLTRNPSTPRQDSLDELRRKSEIRARDWIERTGIIPTTTLDTSRFDDLPVSQERLEQNRAHVLRELGVPAENGDVMFYGMPDCVSLLDILPLFMGVSAARNAMSASSVSDQLMHLLCEFMLQAFLEQYLVCGSSGSPAIDAAFAWGYDDSNIEEDSIDEVNEMFEAEEDASEVESWADIKNSYLKLLCSPEQPTNGSGESSGSGSIISHLETVAMKFPIASFENSILEYLTALSKSIPEPVLAQLESGKVEGMTETETQEFLSSCGVNMSRPFETPS